jgi:threonine aldolase
MFGKEAALYVPSGRISFYEGLMSNQLSIMSWTNPGNEIIIWENAHIIDHEASALTILSAVQVRHVASKTGILTPEEST